MPQQQDQGENMPQQHEAVVYQQFLHGCSRLEEVEQIQVWLSNFERKCKLFGISGTKKTEAALLSMGDEIFADLRSRVTDLGGHKLASEISWEALRGGLMSLSTTGYPLMVTTMKLLGLETDLWERKVPIDTAWGEMIDAFESVHTAAEDELGPICEDVVGLTEQQRGEIEVSLRHRLRKMLFTSILLENYSQDLQEEQHFYSLSPQEVYKLFRAAKVAAGKLEPA